MPFNLIAGHEDIAERVREFRIAKLLLEHPLDSLARILVVTSPVTSGDDMLYAPRWVPPTAREFLAAGSIAKELANEPSTGPQDVVEWSGLPVLPSALVHHRHSMIAADDHRCLPGSAAVRSLISNTRIRYCPRVGGLPFEICRSSISADASGREQRTTGGVNTHGTGSIGVSVTCPVDTDGDFYPDSGGCLDVLRRNIPIGGHRMTLYELDGRWIFAPLLNDDDLVTTLRYPTLYAPVSGILCDAEWCGSGDIGSYKSSTSVTSQTAKARAAVQIVSAQLEDNGVCCDPLNDNTCD